MSPLAELAAAAGAVGVDRDQRPPSHSDVVEVLRDVARELVTRYEGRCDQGSPNPAILVIMQVRTTQSDRRNIEQRLALMALTQIERPDMGLTGTAEEESSAQAEVSPCD